MQDQKSIFLETPIATITWNRINTIADQVSETPPAKSRLSLYCPAGGKDDWKSRVLFIHGHVGPDGGILHPSWFNGDNSGLGKIPQDHEKGLLTTIYSTVGCDLLVREELLAIFAGAAFQEGVSAIELLDKIDTRSNSPVEPLEPLESLLKRLYDIIDGSRCLVPDQKALAKYIVNLIGTDEKNKNVLCKSGPPISGSLMKTDTAEDRDRGKGAVPNTLVAQQNDAKTNKILKMGDLSSDLLDKEKESELVRILEKRSAVVKELQSFFEDSKSTDFLQRNQEVCSKHITCHLLEGYRSLNYGFFIAVLNMPGLRDYLTQSDLKELQAAVEAGPPAGTTAREMVQAIFAKTTRAAQPTGGAYVPAFFPLTPRAVRNASNLPDHPSVVGGV